MPAVLADVYLAISTPLITTDTQNAHPFTDCRVPPLVIAEDIEV